MMNNKESLEQMLASLAVASTRFRPKNSALVDESFQAAELYAQTPAGDRQEIASKVLPELRKKLHAISGFMAEEAMNTMDRKWIRGAILLQLIDDFSGDYRENFRYLALVNYAAKKIGVSMIDVVDSVMPLASSRSGGFLQDFCRRDDRLNGLASFGVKEDVVDGISRFVPAP
jgi:hypothetical protein